MTASIRAKIADFIVKIEYNGLPPAVVHQSKRCLIDFLGVALAAGKTELMVGVDDILGQMAGPPEAILIGESRRCSVLNATLINAIKGHTLDMDDGHRFANAHPAAVVLPAALALAEQQGLVGRDFIAAVVAGYETLLYMAINLNPAHLHRGFHTTANVGAFGAAAACSKILGLEQKQVENALSIAGLCGGGVLEVLSSGQMMKPFQTARAAQAGLLCALLAQRGAQGPELIFEGPMGFFKAYAGHKIEPEHFEGLGSEWEIERVYFKIYCACRHIHAALDAVADLLQQHPLKPEAIAGIEVETYTIASRLTDHGAADGSTIAAKFSMPVCIALMLVFGRLERDLFTKDHILNPLVQSLADKVNARISPERDALYPRQRGAKVTIKTEQGDYMSEVTHPKGEPENPLDDGALIEKFGLNARSTLSAPRVQTLHRTLFNLENVAVRELIDMLSP